MYDPPQPCEVTDPTQGADPIMTFLCTDYKCLLAATPLEHESLLVSENDDDLTSAEKQAAIRAYAETKVLLGVPPCMCVCACVRMCS